MRKVYLLSLLIILANVSYAQSKVYSLHDLWREPKGFWKDSIIYTVTGQPLYKACGSALIDVNGQLAGWTDKAGFMFGADGMMLAYSVPVQDKDVKVPVFAEAPSFTFVKSAAGFSADFFPVLYYNYFPLNKSERAMLRALEMESPHNAIRREESRQRTEEAIFQYEQKATEAKIREQKQANLNKDLEKLGVQKGNSNVNTLLSDFYTKQAEDARNKRNMTTAVTEDRAQFVIPGATLIINLKERGVLTGMPVTERDSILLASLPSQPANVPVYLYNSNNEQCVAAGNAYSYARVYYDSAFNRYTDGDYAHALQWAMFATKKCKAYLNAYVLAYTCARKMEQFELATGLLATMNTEAEVAEGVADALTAELNVLQGNRPAAIEAVKKAYKKGAGDWAVYIEKKYGLGSNE